MLVTQLWSPSSTRLGIPHTNCLCLFPRLVAHLWGWGAAKISSFILAGFQLCACWCSRSSGWWWLQKSSRLGATGSLVKKWPSTKGSASLERSIKKSPPVLEELNIHHISDESAVPATWYRVNFYADKGEFSAHLWGPKHWLVHQMCNSCCI